MDNQIKTSFIPRKPVTPGVIGSDVKSISSASSPPKNVGKTIFSFVATVIFIAVVGGFGAMFVWEQSLKQHISRQEADMKKAIEEFDERFIAEASRLDTRIQQAMRILENHVAPSALYALLSERTLQTVAFAKFGFEDMRDGAIRVRGEGEALRYESIVLQSDSFGRSGYLRNVLFTNLNRNFDENRVEFNFEAVLDPRLVLYKEHLTNSPE